MKLSKEIDSSNRRIAKNALMLYIRMFFTMVLGLYTSRVVLQALGVNDYGIFTLVGGVVVLMNMLTSSLSMATSRFLTFSLGKNDVSDLSVVFSTAFFVHLLLSVFVFIIGETIGLWFVNTKLVIEPERMLAANVAYQAALISTVLSITQVPYNASIISHERMAVFAYITILFDVLKLLIALCLFLFSIDKLILYSVLYAIVSILVMAIYAFYCIRNFRECHIKFKAINKYVLIKMISFSGWSLFANVGETSSKQGVNIILNHFFGTAINAASGVALQVQATLYGFIGNITTAFTPQIVKEYAAENYSRVNNLIFVGTKFTSLLSLLISIPVVVNLDTLMTFWLGKVPPHATAICAVLLVHNFVNSFHPMLIFAINATGKIKKRCLWAGSIHLVNLITALIIVSIFRNAVVVYWIFPTNSFLILIFIIFNLKRIMPQFQHWSFLFNLFLKITIIGGLTLMACIFIVNNSRSSLYGIIFSSITSLLMVTLMAYWTVLNHQERQFVLLKTIKRIKFK